jgi:hypothetical protein
MSPQIITIIKFPWRAALTSMYDVEEPCRMTKPTFIQGNRNEKTIVHGRDYEHARLSAFERRAE